MRGRGFLGPALGQDAGDLCLGNQALTAGRSFDRQGSLGLPPTESLDPDTKEPRRLTDPIASHKASNIEENLAIGISGVEDEHPRAYTAKRMFRMSPSATR